MTTSALPARRQHIREFIDTLMEAHLDPTSARPTLGSLADCLTDETAGLPRDEELVVNPEPYRPHPAGNLRRGHGGDFWAHLPNSHCYLHIPDGLVVHYRFEISGGYVGLALETSQQPGLELSENFTETPVDRLIMDPSLVVILMPDSCKRRDVEIVIP
jgi:hypothetical protein